MSHARTHGLYQIIRDGLSRYMESCHFFLLGWGTGGLSGVGVSVKASLEVTKLSVTLMSRPGSLKIQNKHFNGHWRDYLCRMQTHIFI